MWKAVDKKDHSVVALKKVFDAFQNQTDAQRTYREVMLLEELSGHENIIRLLNVIKAENNKDLYLAFDYMETDLYMVIRAGILQDIHQRYVIYQILKALKYMHSGQVIHRDLKPSNVLLNAECQVKVADLGLARSVKNIMKESNPILTDYIATRWYRAPEILLGSTKYTKAVDMWAVGCILGEMLTGKPLFTGSSTLNQLDRILELTGIPKLEDIEAIQSPLAMSILESLPPTKPKQLTSVFLTASEDALDLLKKLLVLNPDSRMTVEQALEHPYVAQFHNPAEEPSRDEEIDIELNEDIKYTSDKYRDELYLHIKKKKKELRGKHGQEILGKLKVGKK